jgi:hypothetical protein
VSVLHGTHDTLRVSTIPIGTGGESIYGTKVGPVP